LKSIQAQLSHILSIAPPEAMQQPKTTHEITKNPPPNMCQAAKAAKSLNRLWIAPKISFENIHQTTGRAKKNHPATKPGSGGPGPLPTCQNLRRKIRRSNRRD